MTIALCLGAGDCLEEDLRAALNLCEYDFVIACNDAVWHWPGHLDAGVSLHPEELGERREKRRGRGYPEPDEWIVAPNRTETWQSLVDHLLPGMAISGSSGLFTAKVALCDYGADKVVMAGIPLDVTLHCDGRKLFTDAYTYRDAWREIPERFRARMRSMSGWSADFLGRPDEKWLSGV
jgi:hypothetical protein